MKCKKGYKLKDGKCKRLGKIFKSSIRNKKSRFFLPISILIIFALTLINNYFALGGLNYTTIIIPFLEITTFMFISFWIVDDLKIRKINRKIIYMSLVYGILTTIFSLIPLWNMLNIGVVLTIIIFRFISPLIGLFLSKWIVGGLK